MTRRVPIQVHRAANATHQSQASRFTEGRYTVHNLPVAGRVFARSTMRHRDRAPMTHEMRQVYVVTDRTGGVWMMARFWCGQRSFQSERCRSTDGATCVRCVLASLTDLGRRTA